MLTPLNFELSSRFAALFKLRIRFPALCTRKFFNDQSSDVPKPQNLIK